MGRKLAGGRNPPDIEIERSKRSFTQRTAATPKMDEQFGKRSGDTPYRVSANQNDLEAIQKHVETAHRKVRWVQDQYQHCDIGIKNRSLIFLQSVALATGTTVLSLACLSIPGGVSGGIFFALSKSSSFQSWPEMWKGLVGLPLALVCIVTANALPFLAYIVGKVMWDEALEKTWEQHKRAAISREVRAETAALLNLLNSEGNNGVKLPDDKQKMLAEVFLALGSSPKDILILLKSKAITSEKIMMELCSTVFGEPALSLLRSSVFLSDAAVCRLYQTQFSDRSPRQYKKQKARYGWIEPTSRLEALTLLEDMEQGKDPHEVLREFRKVQVNQEVQILGTGVHQLPDLTPRKNSPAYVSTRVKKLKDQNTKNDKQPLTRQNKEETESEQVPHIKNALPEMDFGVR